MKKLLLLIPFLFINCSSDNSNNIDSLIGCWDAGGGILDSYRIKKVDSNNLEVFHMAGEYTSFPIIEIYVSGNRMCYNDKDWYTWEIIKSKGKTIFRITNELGTTDWTSTKCN